MQPPPSHPSALSRFEFDSQASGYDARTQLGEGAARSIAAAVASLARGELRIARPLAILEVGAGTGEIGTWLAHEGAYTGVDASQGMLLGFKARLQDSGNPHAELYLADANKTWPAQDASTDLVFFSRVLHLLERDHVEAELHRIQGASGMVVLAGRTVRDQASVGSQLRRLMLTALEDRGYAPRRGERRAARLFDELSERAAVRIPSREVTTLTVRRSARQRLDAWRNKGGLGGLDLPEDERERVLAEVESWASRIWPNLDELETSEESYCVEGVFLPARSHDRCGVRSSSAAENPV